MKRLLSVASIASLLTTAGCSNLITGTLTVDGATVRPSVCRNLEAYGNIRGVELTDLSSGTTLRVALLTDGGAEVTITPSTNLGRCGSLTIEYQDSTINDIRNVRGTANLSCTTEVMGMGMGMGGMGSTRSVSGSVTFENCH